MKQDFDLNKMGMLQLSIPEVETVDGGRTTFAYDVATFIRFAFQQSLSHVPQKGAILTLCNWASQQ